MNTQDAQGPTSPPGRNPAAGPALVALSNDDYLDSADSLAELLAGLQDAGEDAAVWRRHCLAAVVHRGRALVFEGAGLTGGDAPRAAPTTPLPAGPRGGRPPLPLNLKPASGCAVRTAQRLPTCGNTAGFRKRMRGFTRSCKEALFCVKAVAGWTFCADGDPRRFACGSECRGFESPHPPWAQSLADPKTRPGKMGQQHRACVSVFCTFLINLHSSNQLEEATKEGSDCPCQRPAAARAPN
jgi:hypothetical protein